MDLQHPIIFSQVSKAFCDKGVTHHVLREASFHVKQGESMILMGRSGTGKSILFQCLLGLTEPDQGEIWFQNQRVTSPGLLERDPHFESVGVSFQDSALFDSLTVAENIAFRWAQKHSWRASRAKAVEVLEWVGLPPYTADFYPPELSGGMKRRVSLARALTMRPSILLLDEPTAGLDPVSTEQMSLLIRRCVDEFKLTALTITHDLKSACIVGHAGVFLHEGRIAWQGPLHEMEESPLDAVREFVRASLGNPPENFQG